MFFKGSLSTVWNANITRRLHYKIIIRSRKRSPWHQHSDINWQLPVYYRFRKKKTREKPKLLEAAVTTTSLYYQKPGKKQPVKLVGG